MNKKPVLYSYFQKTAELLLAEYNRSKEQNASANLGKNREYFCREFLSKSLPPKLTIKSGEIWDSEENKTGQLDITVLRNDGPILHIGSDDILLVEGVFGIIEVKSNLTRKKLEEAGNTMQKVENLKSKIGASISSGPRLDRPLRIVFAYEGAAWDTLLDEIEKKKWEDLFDLICILDQGILIKKGGLLNWKTEQKFMVINSKSAAIGYLYMYLVSYGTSFLGRSMVLNPYFEPLNNWQDSN